jgi:hypothetical protein
MVAKYHSIRYFHFTLSNVSVRRPKENSRIKRKSGKAEKQINGKRNGDKRHFVRRFRAFAHFSS